MQINRIARIDLLSLINNLMKHSILLPFLSMHLNEFWETLTNDDVNEIIDKINELISDTHPDSLAENLGNSMMAVSLTVTKTILEKYHLWISE